MYKEGNNRNRDKRVLTKLSDDFHSTTSGTIFSACLKADSGCIDKMQRRIKAIIQFPQVQECAAEEKCCFGALHYANSLS